MIRHNGSMTLLPRLAIILLLAPLAASGCAANGTTAQTAAATKLATTCERTPEDPADKYIAANGRSVTLKLSPDALKRLRAFGAQEITKDNVPDVTKTSSFMEGLGVAMGVLTDSTCLAKAAGTPTDAKGNPKAGDWPNWRVTIDSDGIPTFTSTLKS